MTNSRYTKMSEDLATQHAEILLRGEQLDALRSETEKQIEALRSEILSKDGLIDAFRDEVVGYASSRSWKLTRPLRAFNRLLARLLKR
jgi:hypothetical protein